MAGMLRFYHEPLPREQHPRVFPDYADRSIIAAPRQNQRGDEHERLGKARPDDNGCRPCAVKLHELDNRLGVAVKIRGPPVGGDLMEAGGHNRHADYIFAMEFDAWKSAPPRQTGPATFADEVILPGEPDSLDLVTVHGRTANGSTLTFSSPLLKVDNAALSARLWERSHPDITIWCATGDQRTQHMDFLLALKS